MKNFFFLITKTNQKKIFYFLIFFSIFLAFYEVLALTLIAAFLSFLGNGNLNERIIESLFLLDFFFNYEKILQIKIFIFFLVFLFVTKNLLSFLFLKIISKFLINFKRNITTQLFLNYLNLSYKNFTKEDPSNLLNSIMYDCEQIKIFFYEALIALKEVVTLTILIFIFIYFVHQFQAVNFIIVLFFLSIFIVYLIKKKSKKLGQKSRELNVEILSLLNQAFSSIKDIKIYSKINFFSKFFSNKSFEYEKSSIFLLIYGQVLKIFLELMGIIAFLFLIFLIVKEDINNELLFEKIFAFAICLIRFVPAFSIINTFFSKINYRTKSLHEIILKFKKLNLSNIKLNLNLTLSQLNFLNVNFKNLNYSYNNEKNNLFDDDFTLAVKMPVKIGIYGESGSGKSTFVNILCGLLNEYSGSIQIDSLELRDNVTIWQNNISYVSQKIFLFNDTVERNIVFGNEEINKEQFNFSCYVSGVSDFVKNFENGYNQVLGYDSSLISGGQKQRIGLARAIYQNRQILVLDESFNSLDEKNENLILDKIYNLNKKMLIIISHNKTSIEKCDIILKIQNKKIVLEKSI